MQKITSLFQRNYEGDRLIRDEIVPGAEWVQSGEGIATQKHDGTCCIIRDGKFSKRYEVKKGKNPPADFESESGVDENTGKQQGWVPVGDGPGDQWHREAFTGQPDGTYELCGPKVQGNPEGLETHLMIPHGSVVVQAPRSFNELRNWFKYRGIEGVVWHHPDGRMVKIKAKDFGIKRG